MKRVLRYHPHICVSRDSRLLSLPLPLASSHYFHPQRLSPFPTGSSHRTIISSSQRTSALRTFPSSGFELIDPCREIEEETLPTYRPEKYYPVHLGEVLNDRYQVLAKLGYGVTSTVWLGRDLIESKYVVLKVYVTGQEKKKKKNHELGIYDRMNSAETNHPGRNFIRKLWDHFYINDPQGHRHVCLVHQPLGMSVNELMNRIPGRSMTLEDLKPCLRQLLIAMDFLHSVAHVIHTDLQLKNLLLPAPDSGRLSTFEEAEIKAPSPRKVLEGRTIYTSQRVFPSSYGLPLLSDFGEARFGNEEEEHNEDIMPNVYRAPEVVLKMSWDYKVDIWNAAMVAWDIVCTHNLFDGKNSDGIFDDRVHVAEMVAVLGPPPVQFLERSRLSSVFWDANGKWKELAPIPDITLEKRAVSIRGNDKDGFLRWLRRALQWIPEERPTAEELLFDAWLMEGLDLNKAKQSPKD